MKVARLTTASALATKFSHALAAPLATFLTNSGSNLAASSSFTIARATAIPSFAVGPEGDAVGRAEKDEERETEDAAKEVVTASVRRVRERVR